MPPEKLKYKCVHVPVSPQKLVPQASEPRLVFRTHVDPLNADLARSITPVPEGLHLDFIRASSYHGTSTSSSGEVVVATSNKIPVKARHVLLVNFKAYSSLNSTPHSVQVITQLELMFHLHQPFRDTSHKDGGYA